MGTYRNGVGIADADVAEVQSDLAGSKSAKGPDFGSGDGVLGIRLIEELHVRCVGGEHVPPKCWVGTVVKRDREGFADERLDSGDRLEGFLGHWDDDDEDRGDQCKGQVLLHGIWHLHSGQHKQMRLKRMAVRGPVPESSVVAD